MQLGLYSVLHIHYVECCVPFENWKLVSNVVSSSLKSAAFRDASGTRTHTCQTQWVLLFWYSWSTRELSEILFLGARAGKEVLHTCSQRPLRNDKMCPIRSFSVTCVKSLVLILTEHFLYTSLCFHSTLSYLSIILHPKPFSDFLLSKIQATLAGECNFHSQFSNVILYTPAHKRSGEALLPSKSYSPQALQDCFVPSIIYWISAKFNGIAVLHNLSRHK